MEKEPSVEISGAIEEEKKPNLSFKQKTFLAEKLCIQKFWQSILAHLDISHLTFESGIPKPCSQYTIAEHVVDYLDKHYSEVEIMGLLRKARFNGILSEFKHCENEEPQPEKLFDANFKLLTPSQCKALQKKLIFPDIRSRLMYCLNICPSLFECKQIDTTPASLARAAVEEIKNKFSASEIKTALKEAGLNGILAIINNS